MARPALAPGAQPGMESTARPVEDDVLRIEAEEPVFYIGPDTSPGAAPVGT